MADNSIIRLLKHYILKLKSFLFSKDALSFLLFLVLSSGFWFVNTLDKEREAEIVIPVHFVGIPPDIAITNEPPNQIIVTLKDKGLNLYTAYSKKNIKTLTIDLRRVFYEKGKINISTDQIRAKLSRVLRSSTSVLEVHPDSIFIQYEKLSQKTLPIELVSNIELARQYVLIDDIKLQPSEVTVFGPKYMLDTLQVIKTEPLEMKNVSDTVYVNCKLKPIHLIKFTSNEIKVSIFVEMFTEKKIQLPIEVLNCPKNVIIRMFPAFVDVTFNVGMSHFNSVQEKDISVVFDYKDMVKGNAKQKIKAYSTTKYVSNIRVMPDEVEYIMEMN